LNEDDEKAERAHAEWAEAERTAELRDFPSRQRRLPMRKQAM